MEGSFIAQVQEKPIELEGYLQFLQDPATGALVFFVGTVRHQGALEGEVEGIVYECHEPIARKRLKVLAEKMIERFGVRKVVLVHRFGRLGLCEASVMVAASSVHRGEAFDAVRYGIEQIKHTLPIWKKEILKGQQSRWVEGLPLESP